MKVKTFEDLRDTLTRSAPGATLEVIADDDARVEAERFKTLLPLYSLEAAAGYFGEGKAVDLEGWVEAESLGRLDDDMFVARAVGRSMEPRIYEGDFLVFRAKPKGTRQGKVVLAQGPIKDPEIGGSFTVKRYSSEKVADEDEGWKHARVLLSPLNPEFRPIVVEGGDAENDAVQIVAEYMGKLRI